MKKKTRIRIGVIVAALTLGTIALFDVDYHDLSWENNASNFRQIIIGLLLTASMIYSIVSERKKK